MRWSMDGADLMAAKYRKVDPRFWTDEKVRRLDILGRLLALWMLTGTRTNRVGIIQWSPGLASEETGIASVALDTLCDTVCDTLSWVFDTDAKLVFMTHWWRYNSPDNPKALDGALSDLHDLPEHHLWEALSQAGAELTEPLRCQYDARLDTLCHTLCHTVSPQEQEQEQEKSSEDTTCSEPAQTPDAEPPSPMVLEFPVRRQSIREPKTWCLTEAKLAEYQEAFDNLDVEAQLRAALQWVRDNPTKRKTARGMPRFLGSWLARTSDSGRGQSASGSQADDQRELSLRFQQAGDQVLGPDGEQKGGDG